jgi:quinol monooxygenase YgiN
MIMALIDFEVTPDHRPYVLDQLRSLLEEARSLKGNLTYKASTGTESAGHIGLMHEWDTLENFEAYTSSELFKRMGEILRPAITKAPVSRRLRTELLGEVRG